MRALNNYLIWISLLLLIVSFWNRNDFSAEMSLLDVLKDPPRQIEKMNQSPFEVSFNDVKYEVIPRYDYELYGLVVSYRHHDGEKRLHAKWNDHLNMMDLCVIWSDSAFSPYLNELSFSSGEFTCNVETRSNPAWASFKMNQLANNHLLSIDPKIREQVQQVQIGDQIYLKGQLAEYGVVGSHKRGTSTSREDTGNGACETIYLEEFKILRAAEGGWRQLMYLALLVFVVTLVNYFRMPFRSALR